MILRRFIAFTVLEVLIAFAILASLTGVMAWNVRHWIEEQAILNEFHDVSAIIRNAQNFMLLSNAESDVHIEPNEKKIQIRIQLLNPVPSFLHSFFSEPPKILNHIQSITFEEASTHQIIPIPFALRFISKGFIMNRGILHLKSAHFSQSIVFPGYPTQIFLEDSNKIAFPDQNRQVEQIELMTRQLSGELGENPI